MIKIITLEIKNFLNRIGYEEEVWYSKFVFAGKRQQVTKKFGNNTIKGIGFIFGVAFFFGVFVLFLAALSKLNLLESLPNWFLMTFSVITVVGIYNAPKYFLKSYLNSAKSVLTRLYLSEEVVRLYSLFLKAGKNEDKIDKEEYQKIIESNRMNFLIGHDWEMYMPLPITNYSISKIQSIVPTSSEIQSFKEFACIVKGVKGINMYSSNLRNSNFFGIKFVNINFDNGDLSGSKFHYCAFSDVNFGSVILRNVDFKNSIFNSGCVFYETDFTGVNLEGVILRFTPTERELLDTNYIARGDINILTRLKEFSDWFNYLENCAAKGVSRLKEKYDIVKVQWIGSDYNNQNNPRDFNIPSEPHAYHFMIVPKQKSEQIFNLNKSATMNNPSNNALLIQKKQEIVMLESQLEALRRKGNDRNRSENWGCSLIILGVILFFIFANYTTEAQIISILGIVLFVIGIITFLARTGRQDSKIKEIEDKVLNLKKEIIVLEHS
jgi:hypothetical protein